MNESGPSKTVDQLAHEMGKYPVDAFYFVREGLKCTVISIHKKSAQTSSPSADSHISGQDLCWGLRDFALKRWGFLAPLVLQRWNIRSTFDFGKIVFAMIDAELMTKQENDNINDFRDVYDFQSAFVKNLTLKADMADQSGNRD
jgi:uncharacterized repeat protein (TIGR04138 family)